MQFPFGNKQPGLARLAPFFLFATLFACTPPPGGNTDASSSADLSGTVPDMARIVHDMAHDMVPPPSGAVMGTILDEAGNPLNAISVLCCSAAECPLPTSTLMNGTFQLAGLNLAIRMVKVLEDETTMPRQGESVAPVNITTGGMVIDVGSMYIPLMGAGANLAAQKTMPQTLAVGDGLSVTVIRGDLVAPLGATDVNIVARAIPLAHLPKSGFDVGGETIVAVWALMPFSIASKSPMGVTAMVPKGLLAGGEVHFRTVSSLDGQSSAVAIGHAAKDGLSASTDAGKGLSELTWLLVSVPK